MLLSMIPFNAYNFAITPAQNHNFSKQFILFHRLALVSFPLYSVSAPLWMRAYWILWPPLFQWTGETVFLLSRFNICECVLDHWMDLTIWIVVTIGIDWNSHLWAKFKLFCLISILRKVTTLGVHFVFVRKIFHDMWFWLYWSMWLHSYDYFEMIFVVLWAKHASSAKWMCSYHQMNLSYLRNFSCVIENGTIKLQVD